MTSKLKGSVLVLISCALTAQAQTQIGSLQKASQSETKINSLKLTEILKNTPRPWLQSKYQTISKGEALKEIQLFTKEQIKNPRVQRMGGLDGGGGYAQICETDSGPTIELLDLADLEAINQKAEMGPGDFKQKLEFVFKRLSQVAPTYAAYLASMAKDLLEHDAQWTENSAMPIIEDTKAMTLKINCTHVLVAAQRPVSQKNVPNAKTYVLNKDVFSLLDDDSKAALIIHEVIYRSTRFSGMTDSVFARGLTGVIVSRQIEDYTLNAFNKMLLKNEMKCIEDSALPIMINYDRDTCDFTNYTTPYIVRTGGHWVRPDRNYPWRILPYAEVRGQLKLLELNLVKKSEQEYPYKKSDEIDDDLAKVLEFYNSLDVRSSPWLNNELEETATAVYKINGTIEIMAFNGSPALTVRDSHIIRYVPMGYREGRLANAFGAGSTLVFGPIKFETKNIRYETKSFNGQAPLAAFIYSTKVSEKKGNAINKNPVAVYDDSQPRWTIVTQFGDDVYRNYQQSLEVKLPSKSQIAADSNGWTKAESVTFNQEGKILSITLKSSKKGEDIITFDDPNLLN